MCGFAGVFQIGCDNELLARDLLVKMGDEIIHRGPNSSGFWSDNTNVAIIHRRLSILDLSSAGHQPMSSKTGRYFIAFNGEIYNHLDLREELESLLVSQGNGCAFFWSGHSDTETLLAGIETWGLEETLKRTIGMFAFSLWDSQTKTLKLVRDRMGEKPLYYGWSSTENNNVFLFGSELKALKKHPNFSAEIDRDSISLFLRYGYIPAPHSIYKKFFKLEPGSILSVSSKDPEAKIIRYWNSIQVAQDNVRNPFQGSFEDAVNQLNDLSKDVVKQQMMSDVPLGAFLSGGVDSSAVVSLMQSQSIKPIKTFTIGFNEQNYDEAGHAKTVASYLGTDHTELYVSANDAMDVIPRLPHLYCEPFADQSQIPTFLLSQLAKEHVTVSLSGDGGDELFGGYNRYQVTGNLWAKLTYVPLSVRSITSQFIKYFPPSAWDGVAKKIPILKHYNAVGDKLYKVADSLKANSQYDLYTSIISQFPSPEDLVVGSQKSFALLDENFDFSEFSGVERMMALDMVTYLPDDILVKVDRAAMGVSLETRVPFLDHRIVEFAWSLPIEYKVKNGIGKLPLREMLYRYVPKKLIDRPKMGFGVPLHDWLRGPLRQWAEQLLDETRLEKEGFFYAKQIRMIWNEHLSGRRNWVGVLWSVLIFQAWLELN